MSDQIKMNAKSVQFVKWNKEHGRLKSTRKSVWKITVGELIFVVAYDSALQNISTFLPAEI